ncbi:MAG TPA: hypothetical protein VEZ24_14230 [Microvirga sp.]|nr:hypothetical protein [Microvirga sp.]
MRMSFKTLMAAALLVGGAAAVQPSPASAQTGERDYYAPYARQRAVQPYYRNRAYGYRSYNRYYAGDRYYGRRYYRPAYYGGYRYGYNPYRHYYRRGYDGGAVVAGLIGGLTLGTIAGAVTSPYYYGPGYYRPAYYAPRCVLERRRVINRYGRPVWRRVEVCY